MQWLELKPEDDPKTIARKKKLLKSYKSKIRFQVRERDVRMNRSDICCLPAKAVLARARMRFVGGGALSSELCRCSHGSCHCHELSFACYIASHMVLF